MSNSGFFFVAADFVSVVHHAMLVAISTGGVRHHWQDCRQWVLHITDDQGYVNIITDVVTSELCTRLLAAIFVSDFCCDLVILFSTARVKY